MGEGISLGLIEILALEAGCMEHRAASDGYEDFSYLRGRIFKTATHDAGEPHLWAAPPPVVRAINVLERLSEPLRRRTGVPDTQRTGNRRKPLVSLAGRASCSCFVRLCVSEGRFVTSGLTAERVHSRPLATDWPTGRRGCRSIPRRTDNHLKSRTPLAAVSVLWTVNELCISALLPEVETAVASNGNAST